METDNAYLNLLGELQQHYSQNKVPVYIPSTETTVEFVPISVKQHKNILKVSDNILLTGFQFNININDAILENISQNKSDILLTDRASILLSLKQSMISKNAVIEIDEKKHEVDLKSHVETFKDIKVNKKLLNRTVSLNKFKIHCKIPTIQYDTSINKSVKTRLEAKKEDSLLGSMGEIFIYELIKFIEGIDTGTTSIEFKELTFDQRVQVCEMIPLELSNKIIAYINQVKAIEQKYTKYKNIEGDDIELPLSVTLFAGD